MEECTEAFRSNDYSGSVGGRAVVIARVEERVVVTSLQLQACFQDFGRYVCGCSSKVAKETCILSIYNA